MSGGQASTAHRSPPFPLVLLFAEVGSWVLWRVKQATLSSVASTRCCGQRRGRVVVNLNMVNLNMEHEDLVLLKEREARGRPEPP